MSLSPQALSVTAASVGKRMVVMVFMIVSGVGVVVLIAVSRVPGLSSTALPDGNEREGRRRTKYQTHLSFIRIGRGNLPPESEIIWGAVISDRRRMPDTWILG